MNICRPFFIIVAYLTMTTFSIYGGDYVAFDETRNYSADAIQQISIVADSGDIKIASHHGGDIGLHITVSFPGNAKRDHIAKLMKNFSFASAINGDQCQVKICYNSDSIDYNGGVYYSPMIVLDVTTPENMHCNIDDGAGDITLDGLNGLCAIKLGAGDISATHVMGTLTLISGAGNVNIEGSQLTNIGIKVSSGDVVIKNSTVSGYVHANSGSIAADTFVDSAHVLSKSGDISITCSEQFNTESVIETEVGDINFIVKKNLNATIHAEAKNGDVFRFDKNRQQLGLGEAQREVKCGSCSGSILVRTRVGDIKIVK